MRNLSGPGATPAYTRAINWIGSSLGFGRPVASADRIGYGLSPSRIALPAIAACLLSTPPLRMQSIA
jgi:hypothetical protein